VLLVIDGTTDEAFLTEVLQQGWANIGDGSANRSAARPHIRIYRVDGGGARGIERLVATLAAAHGATRQGLRRTGHGDVDVAPNYASECPALS
jgi:hypothetical protein